MSEIELKETLKIKELAFFEAIKKKNIEDIENLLQNGVAIDCQDENQNTALMLACEMGSLNLVSVLLKYKPNFKAEKVQLTSWVSPKWTPFLIAARYGRLDILKFLIQPHLFPELLQATSSDGINAFMAAAYGGQIETMQFLLEKDSDFYKKTDKKKILSFKEKYFTENVEGLNAFMLAAYTGQYETLRFLLNLNKHFHKSVDSFGENAFILATASGQTPIMRFLLTLDKEAYLANFNFIYNAVNVAISQKQLKALIFLIKLDPTLMEKSYKLLDRYYSIFHVSAYCGNPEIIQFLCSQKPFPIHHPLSSSTSPLMLAAQSGIVSNLKLVLELDPNSLNQLDWKHYSAAHYAIIKEQLTALKYLVSQGIRINFGGVASSVSYSYSSSIISIIQGNLPISIFLNKLKEFCLAVQEGNIPKVERLYLEIQTFNLRDHGGSTLLHQAYRANKPEMGLFLLGKGVDRLAVNEKNNTAFQECIMNGKLDYVVEAYQYLSLQISENPNFSLSESHQKIIALRNEFSTLIDQSISKGINLDCDADLLGSVLHPNYWLIFAKTIAPLSIEPADFFDKSKNSKLTAEYNNKYKAKKNVLSELIYTRTFNFIENPDGKLEFISLALDFQEPVLASPASLSDASSSFVSSSLALSSPAPSSLSLMPSKFDLPPETDYERNLRLKWALKFALQAENHANASLFFRFLSNPDITSQQIKKSQYIEKSERMGTKNYVDMLLDLATNSDHDLTFEIEEDEKDERGSVVNDFKK